MAKEQWINQMSLFRRETIHSNQKQTDMPNKDQCTLSDIDLIEKADQLIDDLARSGGRSWLLNIPARPNEDPDLIFSELGKRFRNTLRKSEPSIKESEREVYGSMTAKINKGEDTKAMPESDLPTIAFSIGKNEYVAAAKIHTDTYELFRSKGWPAPLPDFTPVRVEAHGTGFNYRYEAFKVGNERYGLKLKERL